MAVTNRILPTSLAAQLEKTDMFPRNFEFRSLYASSSASMSANPSKDVEKKPTDKENIPVPLETLLVEKLKNGKLVLDKPLNEGEWHELISWVAESPSQLTVIDVDTDIDSEYLPRLLEALNRNKNITTLVMRGSRFSNEVSRACAQLLGTDSAISHLRLHGNWPENQDAGCLYQALQKNKTLKTLTINNPQFGENSMHELTGMLKVNRSIHTVSISEVVISDDAASWLAHAIRANGAVQKLMITSCEMSRVGLKNIVQGILENRSLLRAGLPGHILDPEDEARIRDVLRSNENNLEFREG